MFYFGYGSLVNRQTRDANEQSHRATLNGWQRQWRHQANRPWTQSALHEGLWTSVRASSATEEQTLCGGYGVCALTIDPALDSSIDGVLVEIDQTQLLGLDEREAGYERVELPLDSFTLEPGSCLPSEADSVLVYVSCAAQTRWANAECPVPLSYVDCVLAGFNQQFGAEGARRFMHSTSGWNRPLLNDRQDPLYPRAIKPTAEEHALIDALLTEFTSE